MSDNCFMCNKRLKLVQVATGRCKCENVYCKVHIHDHNCSYDFKVNNKSQLQTKMPVINHVKVEVV